MTTFDQPMIGQVRHRHATAQEYEVLVRNKVYLWGSGGITVDLSVAPAPILHVWNAILGEPITIGTHKADGTEEMLGTLQPGEHFSIELNDISGVFAVCGLESRVACTIHRV